MIQFHSRARETFGRGINPFTSSLQLLLALVMSSMLAGGFAGDVFAQAEAYAWGGLRGIRVDGELMAFTTGIRAVPAGAEVVAQSNQERLSSPEFSREGDTVTCSGGLMRRGGRASVMGGGGSVFTGKVVYEDTGKGAVTVTVAVTANADTTLTGAYYYIHLPASDFASGTIEFPGMNIKPPAGIGRNFTGALAAIRFVAPRRQLEISFEERAGIVVREDARDEGGLIVYFPVLTGNLPSGQTASLSFTLHATGTIDTAPVTVAVDTSKPGSPFDGIGGNFRLQRPEDPPIIAYNLANLPVTWARTRMPLDKWQPNEDEDPLKAAREGHISDGVRCDMEMAQTLAQKGIPFIVSVWSAPRWALLTSGSTGGFGRVGRIDPEKWDKVCNAIGSYLQYMKEAYGAEPVLFSFNEPDIGIYVLQTAEEHAEGIRRIGAHLVSRGLKTKMLLGDTGNPSGVDFVRPAIQDLEARKYIGAVSFHSWHGGTDEQLTLWGEFAKQLNLPLFSAEGGTDPDAWNYPAMFQEPWFSLDEINLYTRICALSQPRAIIHWQLTADYSVLAGGGDEPLHPTQRFWNLKQLGSAPRGLFAMPAACNSRTVTAAVFGDTSKGVFAVHMVNNGAARPVTLTGLPNVITELRMYVTDKTRDMKELALVRVNGGSAVFMLEADAYTTLLSGK